MDKAYSRRRHSIDAVAIANAAKSQQAKLAIGQIANRSPTSNRRHSMMIVPEQNRRVSFDVRSRRTSLRRGSFMHNQLMMPTTFSGLPLAPKAQPEMENTYKVGPDEGKRFQAHVVRNAVSEVVEDLIEDIDGYFKREKATSHFFSNWYKSNPEQEISAGGKLAKLLTVEVKDKLKTLSLERYKLVVNAFVGSCDGQRMLIASKSLWDTETDGHVTVHKKSAKHYAVVVVHAVYFE